MTDVLPIDRRAAVNATVPAEHRELLEPWIESGRVTFIGYDIVGKQLPELATHFAKHRADGASDLSAQIEHANAEIVQLNTALTEAQADRDDIAAQRDAARAERDALTRELTELREMAQGFTR